MYCRCYKKEHEIVGISDGYAEISWYGQYRFYQASQLKDVEYDYIIVAVWLRKTYEAIKKSLIEEHHVTADKILSFEGMFAEQRVDQVMLAARANKRTYDGVVLGLSHAMCGINPQFLNGSWCNLAFSSEDIYGHMRVMEKCIKEYPDVIPNLNKVIVDLWDWRVFQYDYSRSKSYVRVTAAGGFWEDQHNFSQNTNFESTDMESLLLNLGENGAYSSAYAREMRPIRSLLFDEKKVFNMYAVGDLPLRWGHEYGDFFRPEYKNNPIPKEPDLPGNLFYSSTAHYGEVDENIRNLHVLIDLVKTYSPDVKIYFTLLPRYYMVEKYHEKLLADDREQFFEIIKQFTDEGIPLLNYKGDNCLEISKNNLFYSGDATHMSYNGAVAFTTILNRDISAL